MPPIATQPRARVDYLQHARALAPVFAAAAQAEEDRRELDPRVVAGMHEGGLFRMLLPSWLDGGELDPPSYLSVVEEIARHDASAAWCLNQGSGCSMVTGYVDPSVAREMFGPPNGVLAWGPNPGARARAVEGGYVVNYSGAFASGSRHATWLGAHCLVEEADGTPRRNGQGQIELRTMLFPKARAEIRDVWHVIGLRGTGSDSFVLKDLFVPEQYTVLRDDEATRRDASLVYRFSSNMIYSAGFASVALGIARAVLDAFVETARDKTPRGLSRTVRDSTVVQSEVAQCHAKWSASRHYLRSTVAEIWQQVQTEPRPTLDQRMALRLSSTHAIHAAKEVVDTIYDAAGATAIFESNPFERRFRDIHTVTQQLQGRKAHFEEVGKHILGLEANTTFL